VGVGVGGAEGKIFANTIRQPWSQN
jgi:hypothetical protein